MNSILIFILNLREIAGGRLISPDRGVPPLVFREGWADIEKGLRSLGFGNLPNNYLATILP